MFVCDRVRVCESGSSFRAIVNALCVFIFKLHGTLEKTKSDLNAFSFLYS